MSITSEQYYSLLVYGIKGAQNSPISVLPFAEGPYIDYSNEFVSISPLLEWSDEYDFKQSSKSETIFIHDEVDGTQAVKMRFVKSSDSYNYTVYYYDKNDELVTASSNFLPRDDYYESSTNPLDPTPTPISGAPIYFICSAFLDGENQYQCGGGLVWKMNAVWKTLHPTSGSYIYRGVQNYDGYESAFIPWLADQILYDNQGVAPYGSEGGGGGLYDRPDYEIPIPSLPSISICDSGMCGIYHVTTTMLQTLGQFLWSSSFFDNIIKNYQSPFDNIISLVSVPFSSFQETADTIKIGNTDSNISASKLSTTYYELDCGTVDINEYYKSFADYAPYQAIHLYLPYVGIVEISPDDVMSGSIRVVYHIDVFSGACVAYVQCYTGRAWHVLHSHTGNIITSFPITGANYLQMYRGLLQTAGNALSGNLTQAIDSTANIKPSYQRSGQIGSTAGMMGIQYPYLIFSTPQYIVADTFRETKGQTSNLTCKIGDCSGFLSADVTNDELININATAREIDMIREALAEGIYI